MGSPNKYHSSTIRVVLNSSDDENSTSFSTSSDDEFTSLVLNLGESHLSSSSNDESSEDLKCDSFYANLSPLNRHSRNRIHLDRRSWLEVKDPSHR